MLRTSQPAGVRDLPQKWEWEETIWAEGKLKSGAKRQMAGRQVNRQHLSNTGLATETSCRWTGPLNDIVPFVASNVFPTFPVKIPRGLEELHSPCIACPVTLYRMSSFTFTDFFSLMSLGLDVVPHV